MCPNRMSKIESEMRVVLKFHEAFNRHNIKAMMELKSDEPRFENAGPDPNGAVYTGKEAIRHFFRISSACRPMPV